MRFPLIQALMVALGGALGALARWGLSNWIYRDWFPIPVWTLTINITGSFALGWLIGKYPPGSPNIPLWITPGITVGFIGAYTTFSTYMFETDNLARNGAFFRAAGYVVLSLILGLLAVRGGWLLGQR